MLEEILVIALKKINATDSINVLNNVKKEFLGKGSKIYSVINHLSKTSSVKERRSLGRVLNRVKVKIEEAIICRKKILKELVVDSCVSKEDLTIPGREKVLGSINCITKSMQELVDIFLSQGFSIKSGPDIETQWYNFTALNIGEAHPARQMHDTFYIKGTDQDYVKKVLRTHTSPVQIRTMEEEKPPYKFIAPGRVYRSDSDATHTPMFHQIEGVVVDDNIHMGHLKCFMKYCIRSFFSGVNVDIRFRPSFFPFTQPSAEVDIRIGSGSEFTEVIGCGMIHPNIFNCVGLDSKIYQGFAFGLGVERFAMIKLGIKDIRCFFDADIRWIDYYNFNILHCL